MSLPVIKRNIIYVLLYLCPSVALAAELSLRPDYSPVIKSMAERIPSLMHQHDTPGLALALAEGSRIVWQQGFGTTGKNSGGVVTEDTLFSYGTASSLLLAEAVMSEAGKGRIQPDKSILYYLSDHRIHNRFNDSVPSIHDLLSHHGGLPADVLKAKWRLASDSRMALAKEYHLVMEPRRLYIKSVPGYELLARVVENTSGMTYGEYLEKHIFATAGIETGYNLNGNAAVAYGHIKNKQKPVHFVRDHASSGLYLSASNVASFLVHVLSNNNRWRFRPMNADVRHDLGAEFGYGWALSAFDLYNVGRVAHFSGESLHYQNQTVVLPEHDLAVTVLANAHESRELVDMLARDILAQAVKIKTGIRQVAPKTAFDYNKNNTNGVYATWRGYSSVNNKGKQLRLKMNNRNLFLIDGPGLYRMQYRLFGLVPVNVPALNKIRIGFGRIDDREYMIARFRGWDFIFGEKVVPQKLPEQWQARLGNYSVLNNDEVLSVKDITLHMLNGILCLGYSAPPYIPERVDFPLSIIDDNVAVFSGMGRNLGDRVVFEQKDDAVLMQLSGFTGRKK